MVTGGAVGIDAAAILGAMSGEGPVVSVLPVALNSSYPSRNAFLRQSLLERGRGPADGVFLPADPQLWHLSGAKPPDYRPGLRGVAAPGRSKSGTMLYARPCQGSEPGYFRLAGRPGDAAFAGGRGLIEDGAKAVERGEDILMEYSHRFWREERVIPLFVPQKDLDEQEVLPALADPGQEPPTPLEEAVLAVLTRNPQSAAQLEEQTGLPPGNCWGS